MPRPRLEAAAAQQAHAEYDPQISGVRRETRSQVRSARSMGPALEAALGHSARQLRHAGLSPYDLAIAEKELAHKTADAGASTALQVQQAQQEGHGQIVDLLAARGQAQGSALTSLLAKAAEHAQGIRDEEASETRSFKSDILKAQTEKELGLGTYADDAGGSNGLSATTRHNESQSKHNAKSFAHQLIAASRDGVADPKTGDELIPAGPGKWDDSIWAALTEKVAKAEGVDDFTDAADAVQAIRDHFQPQTDPLDALKRVAAVAAPALAPKPLQPVAQFASALLGR